jgi:hypothetical protein
MPQAAKKKTEEEAAKKKQQAEKAVKKQEQEVRPRGRPNRRFGWWPLKPGRIDASKARPDRCL